MQSVIPLKCKVSSDGFQRHKIVSNHILYFCPQVKCSDSISKNEDGSAKEATYHFTEEQEEKNDTRL